MSKKLIDKVDFSLIRYSNCWEDANVLIKGLGIKEGNKVLSIGSGGDNSFSLLITRPQKVVVVDVNPTQLYLIELKKVCFQLFSHEETCQFLGFTPTESRFKMYKALRNSLSIEAKDFWDINKEALELGVIHQGKFEKYFQLFANKILPWIHNETRVEALFKDKTLSEQHNFYFREWNTWKWRLLFRIFFSKTVMGRLGRDPYFLSQVDKNVGNTILKKAERELSSSSVSTNPLLRYNLTGSFGGLLPHYLCSENYDLIKENLHLIHLHLGSVESAFLSHGKFDRMNLSNIFEYMNVKHFKDTAQLIYENTNQDGRLAYWNLLVKRRLSEHAPFKYLQEESTVLSAEDNGFFYDYFHIDYKI